MPFRLYILCSEKRKTDLIVFFSKANGSDELRMGFGNIHCRLCTVHTVRVLYIIITVKCDCWCFDLKRCRHPVCCVTLLWGETIFTIIDVARSL